ncbi:chloride channel protein C-like [Pezoporus flaviventris]|uniref:chloride channel protein C-like n=1 Tax=Pezoporus flaviventris TaxID=889875 RepID=UPI002AAFE31A|nr:chloride channel protein C-like [Pezoporus flaviventris]
MSSLFFHRTNMGNDEEVMLMAEDCGPDLINSQDLRRQCSISRSSSAYYHCEAQEREHTIDHESLDYLPSHSKVYKKWLQGKTYRKEWDRWLLMGLIGAAVGMLGFLVHQIIDSLIKLKWDLVEKYLQDGNIHMTWLCVLAFGLAMVVLSSGSVLFFCPAGLPSGLPEIIGYLNGTSIRHLFNIKTFLGTFVSCVLAVASGLFCGPEGPMIHLGALLGCGLSQLQSDILGVHLPIFTRFRNSADKRSFITAGAGAGIASVFRAPIGGLLFTFEEVSSFWDIRLAWQTFFCCLMATFTTDLLSSSLYGFVYRGHFGFFEAEKRIIFWVKNLLDLNVLAFIPTILLGMLGGLLGALFVSLNIKINKLRMQFFNSIPKLSLRKISKLLETVLILVCTTTVTVYLPYFFPCTPVTSVRNNSEIINQFKREISEYRCSSSTWIGPDGIRYSNQTFNQAAALLVESGKQGITYLFKRGTHEEFGYSSLCTALAFYFILSCWTAGSAVASGVVIPMLYTGALYGRIIGLILVSIFGVQTNEYGAWIDPGLFAAIGAASFFSGVSRLTISLTVIMVEITNDVQSLLLIMLAVMVAKMVGDLFNASLYSSLLKLKCIPYLDVEPFVSYRRKWLNLELFSASDVMEPGVKVLHLKENVASLAQLLASTSHGGFPVVCRPKPEDPGVFQGTIKRFELCMLLENEHIFEPEANDESFSSSHLLSYEKITVEKLPNLSRLTTLLNRYATDPQYQQLFINLEPYINRSAMSVQAHFSLQRTYIIFRTLGLRHLTVVDPRNQVVGVITRKDLMPFPLEERLRLQLAPQSPDVGEQPLDSRPWMCS